MGILKEHNHQKIINAYTLSDWKPLLDLIPRIERQKSFSKRRDNIRSEKNIIIMPLSVEEPIVGEFREVVNQIPIMIDFDWGGWHEGCKMASEENFD